MVQTSETLRFDTERIVFTSSVGAIRIRFSAGFKKRWSAPVLDIVHFSLPSEKSIHERSARNIQRSPSLFSISVSTVFSRLTGRKIHILWSRVEFWCGSKSTAKFKPTM